ncbi:MAG TPA: toll/interleukin-1 receptor domain-containing protein [Thermoanaerobaculia bacterium]|nr:toll/interleukin-1 receptor domain-containing protein [Thermoanaerobaculia bacterium]
MNQARLAEPAAERPLVYHLFGHYADPKSLVLTEGDLIEFLVAVVRGTPAVPDQVRSMLADQSGSFLFLGFGFHNWYLRVLLQVLNVYGHRSKPIAFEDTQFFSHPDRQQVAGFFSGDRLIEFRPLRWEEFARQLRDAYGGGAAPKPAAEPAAGTAAPKAFLSYASEDRDAVEALAGQLEARGVEVWQDQQDLRAGDKWDRVLIDVIEKRVDYVVVVQTRAMNVRIEGVFHREIATAMKRHENMGGHFRFLVPVTMRDGELLPSLSEWHTVNVETPAGVDALVHSIKEDWQRRMERKRAQAVA